MIKFLTGMVAAAALVACGGGGSDSPGDTPATAKFAIQNPAQAFQLTANVYTFDLSGTCGGSATSTASPQQAAVIAGTPVLVKTTTRVLNYQDCAAVGPSLTRTLTPAAITTTWQSVYDVNGLPLGWAGTALNFDKGQAAGVATLWSPVIAQRTVAYASNGGFPASVKVGDAGVLANAVGETMSYVVESDTETSVIVKVITQSFGSPMVSTETTSYRLTAAGAVTLVRDEIAYTDGPSFVLTPR